MDHSELRKQLELVRGCFKKLSKNTQNTSISVSPSYVENTRLRCEAIDLYEDIQSAALRSTDGSYHWTSVAPRDETEILTLQAINNSLYNGRCGIALLGAGLYHLVGDDRYRRFALDTVHPIRKSIQSREDSQSLTSLGGTMGAGSIAYGLGCIGGLLGNQELLNDAAQVTEYIQPTTIEDDETYDVTAGAAGTILGLLGAYNRIESSEFLTTAVRCGDHLLKNRVTAKNGFQAWETMSGTAPLTGFAHGASGIAYALIRLWSVTNNTVYRDAALEALEYESQVYSEAASNWPDFRTQTSHRYYSDKWCHGRSGIGLARLGMLEYITDSRVTRGIERAVNNISSHDIGKCDHLCCGNAGRAEFLLEAHKRYGQRYNEAREILGGIINRTSKSDQYQTQSEANHIIDPTFFNGVSGIGYTMLRVTSPDKLPCVLLLE